jgi:hypothetical protein
MALIKVLAIFGLGIEMGSIMTGWILPFQVSIIGYSIFAVFSVLSFIKSRREG